MSTEPARKKQRTEPAQAGDDVEESHSYERGKPLDNSMLDYLKRIGDESETMINAAANNQANYQNNQTVDSETREILGIMAKSLFNTIKPHLYRCCVNRQGAKSIQNLGKFFDLSDVSSFLEAVTPALSGLLCDRQGSHALEAVLLRGIELEAQNQSGTMSVVEQCLASLNEAPPAELQHQLSRDPASTWPIMIADERASFVIRNLLKAGALTSSVDSLVAQLCALPQADRIEFCFSTAASPAVTEIALQASSAKNRELFHSMVSGYLLLEKSSDEQDDKADDDTVKAEEEQIASASRSTDWSASDKCTNHIVQLSKHRVGSHLLEGFLTSASQCGELALISAFHRLFLVGSLMEWATDERANHILQSFFQAAHKRKLINSCCEELGATQLKQLMGSGRVGVVWRLVEACGRLRTHQSNIHSTLIEAVATSESPVVDALRACLTANPTPPQFFDYTRCQLVCAWLSLTITHDPVGNAMASLNETWLSAMAQDKNASRIFDKLFESSGRGPVKNKVASALAPSAIKFSKHRIAGFVIEKAFVNSSLEAKRLIATQLANLRIDPRSPSHSKSQSVILKKLQIQEFQTKPKVSITTPTVRQLVIMIQSHNIMSFTRRVHICHAHLSLHVSEAP